jgi:1-deoxy-D-xylulose-5-phosphate synthase
LTSVLERVDSPARLRELSRQELSQLARELREELVRTVSVTGGHLASNLGVVELTLALHRVLDSPRDKIVWDVGHQAYVHKLLTGRRERFATLRQKGGLSGYTDRSESPHDPFGAGHASTSISAALGLATARDLAGEDYHVVAVIGDGALSGGMAFEALNNAGQMRRRLIVVLNDNAMAISPSVGALARSLRRLRLSRRYSRAKEGAEQVVTRLPGGRPLWAASKRVKNMLKGLLIPTMIWEELGFTYIGPVDGHNLRELEDALGRAREYRDKPAFVHVVTKKGKGYPPAEEDAVSYHGVAPGNGAREEFPPTYSQVFGETMLRLAHEEPRLIAITAAMSDGTGLKLMARELPERVFDVGICEQHAVALAAGMAKGGLRPVVGIYSTFLQRAYDQLFHEVALQGLPVVFLVDRAGLVGADGPTHHGLYDIAYLRHLADFTIAAPADRGELAGMLRLALEKGGPWAIRYPRERAPEADFSDGPVEVGRAAILRRGAKGAILALGATVAAAMEAAHTLEKEGITVTVASARFAKPIDKACLEDLLAGHPWVMTLEDHVGPGGFGSAVLECAAANGHDLRKIGCVAVPQEFVEHDTRQAQLDCAGLTAGAIVDNVKALCIPGHPGRLYWDRPRPLPPCNLDDAAGT